MYYANALYADKLYAYIVENDFDTVVMPHLFPAEAVTYMQKKHHLRLASYFIATDYTCIPFTEETSPDYFFVPHEDLIPEFAGRGIPEEKLIPLGIPVSGRFVELPPREECRGRLGIPEGRRCILLMTGSMGYGNVESMVAKLWERTGEDTCIYVMGGTNDGFCASDKEFGNLEERAYRTFCGDLNELMKGLKEKYPSAEVFFATPLPNVLQDYLMSERDYLLPQQKFVDVIIALAKEYNYHVIDLYNSNILDSHDANVVAEYVPDGVHGNHAGYQIIAEHFAAELVQFYEEKGTAQPLVVSGNSVDGSTLDGQTGGVNGSVPEEQTADVNKTVSDRQVESKEE